MSEVVDIDSQALQHLLTEGISIGAGSVVKWHARQMPYWMATKPR